MTFRLWVGDTFSALRSRPFRWLWLGRLASSATFEMGTVVQGWLVYELTGSAFALGWVSSGWSVATLVLSLFAGAICDRTARRAVLLWTRVGMVANSSIVALLISTGLIRIWHLAASSFLVGVLFAFMMPAQQAMISDLVDDKTLLNAMSLNALGMGLMGIFGASMAGQLIEAVGPAAVYAVMALAYAVAVYTITRLPDVPSEGDTTCPLWRDVIGGARYLTHRPLLMVLLGLGLVRALFAMPYRTLMPAFTRDVLGFDARGLGIIMSAPGIGGLVASLTLCTLGDTPQKGRILIGAGLGMGLCLALFPQTRIVGLIFFLLSLTGGLNNVCMVLTSTLLQSNTDRTYLGRVMSVSMMLWGLMPLGTVPAGAVADRTGVPLVIGVQGVMVILLFALAWWRKPELRRLS